MRDRIELDQVGNLPVIIAVLIWISHEGEPKCSQQNQEEYSFLFVFSVF